MADVLSPAQRSRAMSAVRSKNTTPELRLRRALHARGLRFRLHRRGLPGSPDIVLPRFHACVFVHGCFWHRHPGCPRTTTPATRAEYWAPKVARNVDRDRSAIAELRALGWRIAVVWECALGVRKTEDAADALAVWLHSGAPMLELP
jgi:DNA mismatch endonuclease (patch repair protein)